mmetsp:Transcript_22706/g.46276  ORF Transcript_22706/g.46276 Transcript_22706/m.46276 type:complete len:204 (-) Transcript_22706:29-640(-)
MRLEVAAGVDHAHTWVRRDDAPRCLLAEGEPQRKPLVTRDDTIGAATVLGVVPLEVAFGERQRHEWETQEDVRLGPAARPGAAFLAGSEDDVDRLRQRRDHLFNKGGRVDLLIQHVALVREVPLNVRGAEAQEYEGVLGVASELLQRLGKPLYVLLLAEAPSRPARAPAHAAVLFVPSVLRTSVEDVVQHLALRVTVVENDKV